MLFIITSTYTLMHSHIQQKKFCILKSSNHMDNILPYSLPYCSMATYKGTNCSYTTTVSNCQSQSNSRDRHISCHDGSTSCNTLALHMLQKLVQISLQANENFQEKWLQQNDSNTQQQLVNIRGTRQLDEKHSTEQLLLLQSKQGTAQLYRGSLTRQFQSIT